MELNIYIRSYVVMFFLFVCWSFSLVFFFFFFFFFNGCFFRIIHVYRFPPKANGFNVCTIWSVLYQRFHSLYIYIVDISLSVYDA